MTDINYATDVLRLEVETPTAGLPNLIQNPTGEKGAWGWVTPYDDTYLNGVSGELVLTTDVGGNANAAVTELMPFTAGEYTSYNLDVRTVTCSVVTRLDWVDANGTTISSTPDIGPLANPSYFNLNSHSSHVSYQAPAGTAFVRFVIIAYGPGGSGYPPELSEVHFTYVTLTRSTSVIWNGSTGVARVPYAEPRAWVDILGATNNIELDRNAFDIGILRAEILDPDLDPSVTDDLQPGKQVRLRTLIDGVWESKYEGVIRNAHVKYDKSKGGTLEDPGAVRITITAADNMATLTNQKESRGVYDPGELTQLLEGRGVPWNMNGYKGGIGMPLYQISRNENASILDQIALVRDTRLGLAWVDRVNAINVWLNAPTTPVATFDEARLNSVVATNLATDPRGLAPPTGAEIGWSSGRWFGGGGGTGTYTRMTNFTGHPLGITTGHRKTWTVAPTQNGDTGFDTCGVDVPTVAGEVWTLSGYVRTNASGKTAYARINWAGGGTANGTSVLLTPNVWTRVTLTATVPAGKTGFKPVIDIQATGTLWAPGNYLDGTGLMLTKTSTLINYFDGNTPGAVWNGTVNDSTSTYNPTQGYTAIDIDYDTDRFLNHVTVDLIQDDGVESKVLTLGPYTNDASVRKWGARTAKFTVHGYAESYVGDTYAPSILAANPTPQKKVNSLTMRVKNTYDLKTATRVDLCGPVRVIRDTTDLVVRVSGIRTTISANSFGYTWDETYTFESLTSVAPPTQQSGSFATVDGNTGWITPSLGNGWVNFGGWQEARYRRINGVVYVQGLIKSGTLGASALTLDAGFRPAGTIMIAAVDGTNEAHGRLDIQGNGQVVPQSGNNTFFSIDCQFPAEQ